ncbi:MAG TPA: BREX system Lon protease-like protein BrxL [Herpetosiphonaceae bacterium]|nr:BREX system Lon protease-like protein BrxL [Herpetosiphonaceae bacterium]
MDALDQKLLETFEGKVVRKDLLHRIKKGTNVPTFVLEFLLARYCASDEPAEIQAGMEAVLATLQDNYVRPDESNAAQSRVATKGRHRFIDKVHVRYVEKERRHWAALENFNSQRIAVAEKFYRDNDRLLEGGIWAEVTVAHNEVDADNYAFYVEDLRPVQLSRFDWNGYVEGRRAFTRDEWLDCVLRSVGLEPSKLAARIKLHFIARLAALVEPNFNFIELGPRGTGKSYFFSEFSPYSTLVSGGQATKATLFYNNARKRIGLVGFWDTVAFDEVAGIKITDPDTMQIMKDFMANGRFSRGVEVIADASLAFVGNIDHSVEQVVNSAEFDLFMPLPREFDLAILDRFACYLPGWEMPKNSSEFLTSNYGFITDYLAEAFHHQFAHTNRYEEVSQRIRLGAAVEGRDEKGIKKTVCAFLKILHPDGQPSDSEFEEYVAYAVESRRRVKEQMNKRKPDEEFARIELSYIGADGQEKVVYCPESRDASATLQPRRRQLDGGRKPVTVARSPETPVVPPPPSGIEKAPPTDGQPAPVPIEVPASAVIELPRTGLREKHFTILYGDTGQSYESIIGPYLEGARSVVIEEPYIRAQHQMQNFVRFCETLVVNSVIKQIRLVTNPGDDMTRAEVEDKLGELKQSLLEIDIVLEIEFNPNLHDREIRLDNGWVIKIGRGLDFYQRPESWFHIGANDLSLRRCLETKVDIFRREAAVSKPR